MEKHHSLRAALAAARPELDAEPDRLQIYADLGRIVSRRTPSLGFAWRYRLRLFFRTFQGSADAVMVPLLLWLREHQPDLLLRYEQEDEAIQFAADILDDGTIDLALTFELSESVVLKPRSGGGWDVTHLPEPSPDDLLLDGASADVPLGEIWLGGERLLPAAG